MKKQIAVIGLGRFGTSLAATLFSMGHDVLALDKDEKRIQNVASQLTHAVQADATNEAILKELGIGNFDVAVVSMGSSIESSVLSTILLKKLGVSFVVARAENKLHGEILDKIGADKVVYAEREIATSVAHWITLSDVVEYISVAPKYGVSKLIAPPYLVGKSLSSLQLVREGKWGVAVLLIQREKEVIISPGRTEIIKPNDILIVAGNDDNLEQLLANAKKKKLEEEQ